MEDQVREILIDIGYHLHNQDTQWFRTSAIYRGGDNSTTLAINKQTGAWKDFKTGDKGSLYDLIKLTLNISDSEAKVRFKDLKIKSILYIYNASFS